MNEKHNGRGIFYGVIGVATLVVAIIGATFAYFTATASNETAINGNFTNVSFDLAVTKVTTAGDVGGLIPMTNGQVDTAIGSANSDNGICIDDNGNAVCQIYKIVATNNGSAQMFIDGYVTLAGGPELTAATDAPLAGTFGMRWAQAFCTETDGAATACTTSGTVYLSSGNTTNTTGDGAVTMEALASTGDTLHNASKILTSYNSIKGTTTISSNPYDTVGYNFIRISQRTDASATTYSRTDDYTSALVWNQQLAAAGSDGSSATYYIVVWLSETGTAQNEAGSDPTPFTGKVVFNSAQGSEITATFSSAAKITADTAASNE